MLSVTIKACYAVCHLTKCRYAKCHYAECRDAVGIFRQLYSLSLFDKKVFFLLFVILVVLEFVVQGLEEPTKT